MYTPTTAAHGISSDKLTPHVFVSEHLPLIWDEIEPMLERSIDVSKGAVTLKGLYNLLSHGEAVTFATLRNNRIELVVVARFVEYPDYRAARIIACAGKGLKEAMKFVHCLETWAFEGGCVEIEGFCHDPRTARLCRQLGFGHKFTAVSKNLRGKLQ